MNKKKLINTQKLDKKIRKIESYGAGTFERYDYLEASQQFIMIDEDVREKTPQQPTVCDNSDEYNSCEMPNSKKMEYQYAYPPISS